MLTQKEPGLAQILADATLGVLKREETFFEPFEDLSTWQCSERHIQYLLWQQLLFLGHYARIEDEYNRWRNLDIGIRNGGGANSSLFAAVEMKGPWGTRDPRYCARKASPDFAKLDEISRGPRWAGGDDSVLKSQRVQCYFLLVLHGDCDDAIATAIGLVLDLSLKRAFPAIDTSSFQRSYSQTMALNRHSQRTELLRQQVAVVQIPEPLD